MPQSLRPDLVSTKVGDVFVAALPDGDLSTEVEPGCGLYHSDMRYLSDCHVSIRTSAPVAVTQGRSVADGFTEGIQIGSAGPEDATVEVSLRLATDFADIYEVRGYAPTVARSIAPPAVDGGDITFGHRGTDANVRTTAVELRPPPDEVEAAPGEATARWRATVGAGRGFAVFVTVTIDGRTRGGTTSSPPIAWPPQPVAAPSGDPEVAAWIERSLVDLETLITPLGGCRSIAAGTPWYVAPFGRDSFVTAWQTLTVDPTLARDQLLLFARHQATQHDDGADAEPGKIAHEIRSGELARFGAIPNPYYGSADATCLFVMLAALYHERTGDLDTMRSLEGHLRAALAWIDAYGDADGDGFIEYRRRASFGLDNQGWKDSPDAVIHPDGTRAEGPIALVEVQAYAYAAKRWIAPLFRALGDPGGADRLDAEAAELHTRFNDSFFRPEVGFYALALDGAKRPVETVTSNPGHALFCGIVPDERAALVRDRLLARDMFSGWGIRTMAASEAPYDPRSYHNGSVWPHDNSIIAAGFARYGFIDEARLVFDALRDAARCDSEYRLPELFCGFHRVGAEPYVAYPSSCSPQAWAAGVPFPLLAALEEQAR